MNWVLQSVIRQEEVDPTRNIMTETVIVKPTEAAKKFEATNPCLIHVFRDYQLHLTESSTV